MRLVLLIGLILFIIPFFWLKPGEMDLGGDANRLYFYEPITFLKSTALYGVAGEGKGIIEPKYSYLPYVGLIAILKIFISSTAIISFFNGMKLAVGFIGIFLIVRELLFRTKGKINKKLIYASSILAGIFYVVSFGSIHMAFFWDRALFTHDQIFLNPLIFYLLYKFIFTNAHKYLWIALLISFVFATNFSLLASAPPMFAFYPLAVIFLLSYAKMFGKKPISWKGVGVGVLFFLGIHAFHFLAEVASFFDSGSNANSIVFSKEEIEAGGVNYFVAVRTHGRAILNLLIPSEKQFFGFASLIAPLVVIVGFLLNIGRKKELLFISAFFIITFFLVTANITNAGFELYRKLFYLPGFSMFRNFYTQWMYIFIFFYSILFGFSIYGIFLRLKPFYSKLLYLLVFVLLVLPGIPLFMGDTVNKNIIRGSNNVRGVIEMDTKYEQTVQFIRTLPDDGKILVLPLTDFFRQVVYGRDGGVYEGPSTILHLTDKYSFVGYQHFGYKNRMPYAEDVMKYSREKDYEKLLRIFTLLNIRYIYHNTDPKVYEENFFKGSSYGYMQTSMPKTQDAYKDFIQQFPVKTIYRNGQYVIYEIDKSEYNPTIFIPDGIYKSSKLSFDKGKNHSVFIDGNTCGKRELKNLCTSYKKPNADIKFSMINPTLYSVNIRQNESAESIFLVMQHTFHKGWKLVLDGKYIAEDSHILANGYANGWFVSSKDLPKDKSYKLFVKLDPQKYFWYGWKITLVFLVVIIGLFILLEKPMKKVNIKTAIFILISIILFIIPFFWLKPGEMDLGGDSNRLYFYDPLSNLKAFAIYSSAPWGVGEVTYNQYFIPYLLFIISLKSIFSSPTILIAIFNGFKLAGSFIFVFLIIKELIKKEEGERVALGQFSASLLGALFYTFSPSVIENMRYALVTHSQVFLNPMIFYLLLRYLITSSFGYIWLALLVTVVFSTNFSLQAPPPLFAFYPLVIIFLLFYNFFILKKSFPWKGAIIGILFFLGLHAFHLIPVTSNIFDKGSEFNTRIFESKTAINAGLEYFNATLPLGKVSRNILLPLEHPMFSWSLFFIPLLIILGFLSMHRKNRTLSLISVFFFITLFLGSANITEAGVEVYRKLFIIPGFGMFRNFSGQWQWVYTFFYAILAGLLISYFFSRIKIKYIYLFSFLTIGFLIVRSWTVFNGDIVNVFNRGSKNVKVVMRMDSQYEQLLAYLKKIPNDGKIFHVPFTDFAYNLVGGSNGSVYVGHSMISMLTQKNDFSGYHYIDPFSEVLVRISREKNYPLIRQMMSLLQVRYVLYNSDPLISDKFFPTFPYGYTGVPASPSGALDFVRNISHKKIYEIGHYSLYEVDKIQYLPNFYIASDLFFYDTNLKYHTQYFKALSFFPKTQENPNSDPRIVYIDRKVCSKILPKEICSKNNHKQNNENIQIIFQKINPTKYKVEIKNATKPFLLVFQSKFSPHWKIYPSDPSGTNNIIDSYYDKGIIELSPENQAIDIMPFETNDRNPMYDNTHVQVNGYANGWYINPSKSRDFSMIVETTRQKLFYYSLGISLGSLFILLLYGIKLLKK